jgi:hypothetical protein
MNAGYNFLMRKERPSKHQGFFLSVEEVEHWAASGDVSNELLSFVQGGNSETEHIFVYTHSPSGPGMAQPTAEASLNGGVLDVAFHDQCDSGFCMCDFFSSQWFLQFIFTVLML